MCTVFNDAFRSFHSDKQFVYAAFVLFSTHGTPLRSVLATQIEVAEVEERRITVCFMCSHVKQRKSLLLHKR